MLRRLRPVFLVLALLLTGAALGSRVQAGECVDGDFEWANLGDCCWQFSPPVGKLHLLRCIGGVWVVQSIYKCPTREPCG
jgi:hypothetical protein